jgi:tetratricopeptide (TPR) repeat protein
VHTAFPALGILPRSLLLATLLALLTLSPATAQDLLTEAESAYDRGEYETAIALADSMVTLDTLNINDDVPTALKVEAQAHRELGDWKEALTTLDEALNRDPFFAGAYELKARILTDHGDVVKAQAAAREAARLEPQSQSVQILFANIQFKTESYGAAIDTYTRVLSLNPTNVEALINRGRSHLKLGQLEQAYFDAVDAVEIVPDRPAPYRVKAEAEFRARQFQNAANTYGTLIEKLKAADASALAIATAYSNRGQAKFNLGNLDAAIEDLDQAVQIAPDLAVAYRTRGMAYGRKEQRDPACTNFRRALDLGLDEPFKSEVQEIVDSYCQEPTTGSESR